MSEARTGTLESMHNICVQNKSSLQFEEVIELETTITSEAASVTFPAGLNTTLFGESTSESVILVSSQNEITGTTETVGNPLSEGLITTLTGETSEIETTVITKPGVSRATLTQVTESVETGSTLQSGFTFFILYNSNVFLSFIMYF